MTIITWSLFYSFPHKQKPTPKMNDFVTQLYPSPAIEHKNEPQFYIDRKDKRPLHNLYLSHNIRRHAIHRSFVYANFVTSVDGRIAIPHSAKTKLIVPTTTANERDWRLFQELAAQADIIISSGRYLREWANGRVADGHLQEILQINDPRFADLHEWRVQCGLSPQPDIAIISNSLDFPIPDILTAGGRKVLIFTTAVSSQKHITKLKKQAGRVLIAGENNVDGSLMVKQMAKLGYHAIYSAAGPKILHLLLISGALNRLYITQTHRLLGGRPFATILEGELLPQAISLDLYSLYFDPDALAGDGQMLSAYHIK